MVLLSARGSSTTGFQLPSNYQVYTKEPIKHPKGQAALCSPRVQLAPYFKCNLKLQGKGFAAEAMLFGIKKDSSFILPPPPACFSCFIQNLLL